MVWTIYFSGNSELYGISWVALLHCYRFSESLFGIPLKHSLVFLLTESLWGLEYISFPCFWDLWCLAQGLVYSRGSRNVDWWAEGVLSGCSPGSTDRGDGRHCYLPWLHPTHWARTLSQRSTHAASQVPDLHSSPSYLGCSLPLLPGLPLIPKYTHPFSLHSNATYEWNLPEPILPPWEVITLFSEPL